MQINTGSSQTNTASSTSTSSASPVVGTILRADVKDNAILLQVGEKVVTIPWQSGLQAGDQVSLRMGASQNLELQKLVSSNTNQSTDTSSVLFSLQASDLGTFLDSIEKTLSDENPVQADTKALLRTILPGLSDPNVSKTELPRITSPLFEYLLESTDPQVQKVGVDLQKILARQFPGVELVRPSVQQAQDLLGALASNDFAASAPLLRNLAQQISTQSTQNTQSPTTVSPPQPRDLQVWARLAAPLQELSAWGAPPELATEDIKTLQRYASQVVSLPLEASPKALKDFDNVPPQFIARVVSSQDRTLVLEIIEPEENSTTPTTLDSPDLTSESKTNFPVPVSVPKSVPVYTPVYTPISAISAPASSPTSSVPTSPPIRLSFQIPEGHPWAALFKANTVQAFQKLAVASPTNASPAILASTPIPQQVPRVVPQPDSAYIPPESLPALQKNETPLTANVVDARAFISEYVDTEPSPRQVANFANTLHQLDLQLPHGETLQPEQKDLALRWMLSTQRPESLQGLVRYRSDQDPESDLFEQLPAPQKKWLNQELEKSGFKPLAPKELAQLLQKMPAPDPLTSTPAERDVVQHLQKQVQWTQFDQDSRPPEDRQQVFYFYQGGELHKGRVQFKREGSSKKSGGTADDTKRFYVETRTAQLGKVHIDFQVRNSVVSLDFADSQGKAQSAIEQERPTLAKELDDVGLSLGNLAYKLLQESVNIPERSARTTTPQRNGLLDLRA